MKHHHIVVGQESATHIENVFKHYELQEHVVLPVIDDFSYGPLRSPEVPFSVLRNDYWNSIKSGFSDTGLLQDLERILDLLRLVKEQADMHLVHIWIGGTSRDLLAYFFLLHYLKPIMGSVHIININGLPFLNDNLQLFYPQKLEDINFRGIQKALKLSRIITASEFEADADEWKYFQQHPLQVRILKTGKKIDLYDLDYFDQSIIEALKLHGIKKFAKILSHVKATSTSYDAMFVQWRMNNLIATQDFKPDDGVDVINSQ